ncbi:hypothetical protein THAOC_18006 [Thalassiosira oceanica]|uniref:Uncharacterized protein n=1 Tax=Thalassiosira oceanica TaxID=159749 RepID=K0S987_THAOC|nr:hypothetical protein THAOC_18006 [Thalassiosira oceanica]|eukprot:EJK61499.1 hypothetical protein THAOC_18006 [Thalassiosira oceanica]
MNEDSPARAAREARELYEVAAALSQLKRPVVRSPPPPPGPPCGGSTPVRRSPSGRAVAVRAAARDAVIPGQFSDAEDEDQEEALEDLDGQFSDAEEEGEAEPRGAIPPTAAAGPVHGAGYEYGHGYQYFQTVNGLFVVPTYFPGGLPALPVNLVNEVQYGYGPTMLTPTLVHVPQSPGSNSRLEAPAIVLGSPIAIAKGEAGKRKADEGEVAAEETKKPSQSNSKRYASSPKKRRRKKYKLERYEVRNDVEVNEPPKLSPTEARARRRRLRARHQVIFRLGCGDVTRITSEAVKDSLLPSDKARPGDDESQASLFRERRHDRRVERLLDEFASSLDPEKYVSANWTMLRDGMVATFLPDGTPTTVAPATVATADGRVPPGGIVNPATAMDGGDVDPSPPQPRRRRRGPVASTMLDGVVLPIVRRSRVETAAAAHTESHHGEDQQGAEEEGAR